MQRKTKMHDELTKRPEAHHRRAVGWKKAEHRLQSQSVYRLGLQAMFTWMIRNYVEDVARYTMSFGGQFLLRPAIKRPLGIKLTPPGS